MARLPVLHKRQLSKREQVLDDLAKRYAMAVVAVKHAPTGAKLAASGAKTYATTRWSTTPKRSRARFFVIPVVVVASGVVVMRKVRKNGNSSEGETERPLGPVASADTVSPPADAAAAAAQSEAAAAQSEASAN